MNMSNFDSAERAWEDRQLGAMSDLYDEEPEDEPSDLELVMAGDMDPADCVAPEDHKRALSEFMGEALCREPRADQSRASYLEEFHAEMQRLAKAWIES